MKKILLLVAAAAISSPVLAGPYINLETKAKYTGTDYKSRGTDLHVGYEDKVKDLAWYIQGGKTVNSTDAADSDSNWSGKTGLNVPVTDKVKVYGELSFSQVEDADNNWGTKLGTKYSF